MTRILVTGASGFIGSHLVTYHRQKGDEVLEVDLLTGQDLCVWQGLPEALRWAEAVYHMAAIVGQRRVLHHPVYVLQNNIHACDRLLETAASVNPKCPILIASSSEVYRFFTTPPPFEEKTKLIFPSGESLQTNYPLSKYVNEVSALSYVREKGLHCVIARIFNTVGPGQTGRYGMVFPSFISQAKKNEPLTVYGNGSQTRSFCHVRDMVTMLSQLLMHPDASGEIFNVGNDEGEISILELANRVIAIIGSHSTIQFLSYEEAYGMAFSDTMQRFPDISKLKKYIEIPTFHPLEEAIKEIAGKA